jgi:hypothetical protein
MSVPPKHTQRQRTGIPWLFVVNAIGYVPTAWALLNARTDAPAENRRRTRSGRVVAG